MPDETGVPKTRNCPYCEGVLLAKALQCRHCRRWMPEALAPAAPPPEARPLAASFERQVYSSGQLSRHLVLLSVFTLGLYELYWFWRNWRDLSEHAGVEVSPGWRTLGLLVPIINVFMVHHQLRMVHDTALERGVRVSFAPAVMTATFFFIALLGNVTTVWVLSLLNVLALVPVQETLNRLWQRQQPSARLREEFIPAEVAVLVIGACITAVAVIETYGR